MSRAAPAPPPAPRRLAAVAGSLAAVALVVSFFLPVFRVDRAGTARLARHVEEAAPERSVDRAVAEDFVSVFTTAARQGALTPADLVHYARVAGPERENLIYEGVRTGSGADPAAPLLDRLLVLLLVLAAAPPAGALVLLGYFLAHRFRRARSPVLILALVVGALGAALPVGHQYASYALAPYLRPAPGLWVMLGGGTGLLLVALFGVTVRNWWRVYVLGGVTLACVGTIGWAYLTGALTT